MIHRLIAYSLIVLGIGGTIYMGVEGIYGDQYDVPSMSLESFSRQYGDSSDFILIDVRTAAEIKATPSRWPNAINMPLLNLEERYMELTVYEDKILVLLCPTGNRSRQGARLLRLAGFDAIYLKNGMFSTKEQLND